LSLVTARAERTKARLKACALDLFTTNGYDATTVEQIAKAAGVSHMTFFRHFPTKEAVVIDDPYDPLIGEAVRAQPVELPALERARRGMLAAWTAAPPSIDLETQARVALTMSHRVLRAKAVENTHESERVIAEALMDTGTPRSEAVVAAGAVMGAAMAALFDWGMHPGDVGLGPCIVAALRVLGPLEDPRSDPPSVDAV
jgi:AcrR family transcriptional regulator